VSDYALPKSNFTRTFWNYMNIKYSWLFTTTKDANKGAYSNP